MNRIGLRIYGLLLCLCLLSVSCKDEDQDGCEALSFDCYEFEIGSDGGIVEARAKHDDNSWWLEKIKIEEIYPDGNIQTKGEFQLRYGDPILQSLESNFCHDGCTVKKENTKLIVTMTPNNTGNEQIITIFAGHLVNGKIVKVRQAAL